MDSFRDAIYSGRGLHPKTPLVSEKEARGASEDDLGSVAIPRSEKRAANHRDDDRHRLSDECASVRHEGESHAVELVNLSAGGAMIRADFKPRMWDRIDLSLGDGPALECAVRWLRGDRIGLEFAHETRIECDPEVRDELLLEVIRRSFPHIKAVPTRQAGSAALAPAGDQDDAVANSRRTERRHPLIWSGRILYNHDSEVVRLRNISENGALIESSVAYPLGAEVFLDLGEAGQHFATVSWGFGDKVGIKFFEPFDMKLLGSARPEVAPALMIRPGPAGRLSVDKDNPWAEGWGRQSLDELREDLEGFMKR